MEEIFYIAFRIIYSNFALFFKGYLGFFTACLKAKKQLFYNMPSLCRREWQPTPIFLPGESHRQGSLAGYSPWGQQESDTTEPLNNNNAESSFSNYSSGRWKAVGQSQHPSLSLSLCLSLSVWAQEVGAAGVPQGLGPLSAEELHLVKASLGAVRWTPQGQSGVTFSDAGRPECLKRGPSLWKGIKELREDLLTLERGKQILNINYQINWFRSAKLACAPFICRQGEVSWAKYMIKAWPLFPEDRGANERYLWISNSLQKQREEIWWKFRVKGRSKFCKC